MGQLVHAVGVIFANKAGEIVVLKRAPGVMEGGRWGLVGGKVAIGERAIETAVKKVRAEIGLKLGEADLELVHSYRWKREGLDLIFDVFRSRVLAVDEAVRLDHAGNVGYQWVRPQEWLDREDLMEGLYPILRDLFRTDK